MKEKGTKNLANKMRNLSAKQKGVCGGIAAGVVVLAVVLTVALTRNPAQEIPQIEPDTQAVATTQETTTAPITETETAETQSTETKPDSAPTTDKTTTKKAEKPKATTEKATTEPTKPSTTKNYAWQEALVGSWGITETIQPSELYDSEFLEISGFSTPLELYTGYRFYYNGNFKMTFSFANRKDFEEKLRNAYYIYFQTTNPALTQQELEYYAGRTSSYECNEFCITFLGGYGDSTTYITGTYTCDDRTIYYQTDSGEAFSETYQITDTALTLTGSSLGNEGYPVTLNKTVVYD
ncbi:MAG: hypothetical protein Q4E21_06605 [Clostridia bacterium]|nr:hypothetical protein [Clostridia bacterium]